MKTEKRYADDFLRIAMNDFISVHKHFKSEDMVDFVNVWYKWWRKDLLRQRKENKIYHEYVQSMMIGLRVCRDDMLEKISKAK
jgi:hypothetical protein